MISVHGLIRSSNLELGRDRDTGGQTKYVVELAKNLAKQNADFNIDLVTAQIFDDEVSADYKAQRESLSKNSQILRFPYGTNRYIRKEQLWSRLEEFTNNVTKYYLEKNEKIAIIHSHYADAALVAEKLRTKLAQYNLLEKNFKLVHTGHSLGRVKLIKLLEKGIDRDSIEEKYAINQRILVEEEILANADHIIASSKNEIDEQYGMYDNYQKSKFSLIPPGVDIELFEKEEENLNEKILQNLKLKCFLADLNKPTILSICRPDERKNISSLIIAYAKNKELQEKANLVLLLGSRKDIKAMNSGPAKVLTNMLLLIDKFNLYGKVAYPKEHLPHDVTNLYKYAAKTNGVFVNPALTEPFGLTLLEASASGLPLVATRNGGPKDIINNCQNGILVDPLNTVEIAEAILKIINKEEYWQELSENGLTAIHKFYSWQKHCEDYLSLLKIENKQELKI